MIDRLQRDLAELEHLTSDEQEELALYIEALLHMRDHAADVSHPDASRLWHDPAGAWSDLPEDDEAATFYRMRHATKPSAPIEL